MSEFQIGKNWHLNWYPLSLWNSSWLDLFNDMLSETIWTLDLALVPESIKKALNLPDDGVYKDDLGMWRFMCSESLENISKTDPDAAIKS